MPPSTPTSPATAGPLILDRSGHERADVDLIDAARAASGTRVLLVRGDAAPVRDGALVTLSPAEVRDARAWAFLGRDTRGAAVLLALTEEGDADVAPGVAWASLRIAGGQLAMPEAEALRTAVALAGWLRDAAFCPACGGRTRLQNAGWSRHCPDCGREHFPRTDPAVIVLPVDESGERVLLGSNALWGGDRYSCFAGFAEAGESLEDAVTREVFEEAGVRLREVEYRGSQAWPYPRSLMLGFRARVVSDAEARADGEEIVDVRWFTRAELGAALRGEGGVQLPGPASIARQLIEDWHGGTP